jgi:type VII secretion integral membrane protein EccD
MTTPGGSDTCRLTICGPSTSVDVSVPTHVVLADLLPSLVRHLGTNLPDAGLEHGGWVLQRLGAPAFDEDLSPAGLGLRDGDVLHLRPRSDQLPPLDFDDLIDGVAVGISRRPDRWRPAHTRRMLLRLMLAPIATAWILLASAMTAAGALTAALIGAAFLAVASACRSFDDKSGAGIFGAASIGYLTLAGCATPALVLGTALTHSPVAPLLLAAGAAAAGASFMAAVVIETHRVAFAAVAVAGALAAIAGVFAFTAVGLVGAAAIVLLVVVPLGALVPMTAFKLAGMRLEPVPTTPEELQQDLDPEPSAKVLSRTEQADRYMTSLYITLGAVATACVAVLALGSTVLAGRLLALTSVILLLLHSRVMLGTKQRWAVLSSGTVGLVLLVVAGRRGPQPWLHLPDVTVVIIALAVVAILYVGSHVLPNRRTLPHWGRVGDLLQSACAMALLPLALWLLGIYQVARGLGG